MATHSNHPWYLGNNKEIAITVTKVGKQRGHEFPYVHYGIVNVNGIPMYEYFEDSWGGPAELTLQEGINKDLIRCFQKLISHYYLDDKQYKTKFTFDLELLAAHIIELIANNSKERVDNTPCETFNNILNKDIKVYESNEWKKIYKKEISKELWR